VALAASGVHLTKPGNGMTIGIVQHGAIGWTVCRFNFEDAMPRCFLSRLFFCSFLPSERRSMSQGDQGAFETRSRN